MTESTREQQKRQVAYKVKIEHITEGNFIKNEGWDPSFVSDNFGRKLSRVNIIATVVTEIEGEGISKNFYVDDGSSRIQARTFDDETFIPELSIGTLVNLIGKVRQYNDEKYLIPEVVKIIENEKWVQVRQKELEIFEKSTPRSAPMKGNTEISVSTENIPTTTINEAVEEPVSIEDMNEISPALGSIKSEKEDLKTEEEKIETVAATPEEVKNEAEDFVNSTDDVKEESVVDETKNTIEEEKPISLDDLDFADEEAPAETSSDEASTPTEVSDKSPTDIIYEIIKEKDDGSGVDIEEIIEASGNENAEKIITNLLMEGEVFEISPGKIKVLE